MSGKRTHGNRDYNAVGLEVVVSRKGNYHVHQTRRNVDVRPGYCVGLESPKNRRWLRDDVCYHINTHAATPLDWATLTPIIVFSLASCAKMHISAEYLNKGLDDNKQLNKTSLYLSKG